MTGAYCAGVGHSPDRRGTNWFTPRAGTSISPSTTLIQPLERVVKMKYVLVSGGVISGIGKGVSSIFVIPLLSPSHCDSS